MANPIAGTSILTSTAAAGGVPLPSTPIMLDPTARVTSILLGMSALLGSTSSGTSDVTVQVTFDTLVGPNLAPSPLWNNISTQHFSSASGATLLTFTGPIAGLRLNSSAFFGAQPVTLKALQAITAGP